jgi:S-adenosylmethionine hydrolase
MFGASERHRIPRQQRPRRIGLLTDFGNGPYTGQMKLLLTSRRWSPPVTDLVSDLPPFRPDLAAYLLPGLSRGLPPRTLYLCVVDPGVGSDRAVVAARVGSDWWLAPDNGLLVPLLRAARADIALWRVDWRPARASATFHGRDLFTPIAAGVLAGALPAASTPIAGPDALTGAEMPMSLPVICYVDHYGNAMSGVPIREVAVDASVVVGSRTIRRARTFSDVPVGEPFWYANAFGLVEIAVNQGRADATLGLCVGDSVAFSQ